MALVASVDFGEMQSRPEFLRFPGLANNTVQLINLLEGETLGFVDHEVSAEKIKYMCTRVLGRRGAGGLRESDTEEAAGPPDEEHLGLEVSVLAVDHVGR